MKVVILSILTMAAVDAARILAVTPIFAHSHHVMFNPIFKALAKKGHQIINFSFFPADKPVDNYTVVHLNLEDPFKTFFTKERLQYILDKSPVGAASLFWAAKTNESFSALTFQNEDFQELLNSNTTFDLVFVQPFFGQEPLVALGHRFKCPVISLHTFGAFSLASKTSGNPLSLAYIPDFAFPSSDHMSFYERFLNAYSILSTLFRYYTQYLPEQDEFMRTVFKDPSMPSLIDMLHNISFFINNVHPVVHYVQPYAPNLIQVGGIHLLEEQKPLPSELKTFLDNAQKGVIYFSLGSLVPDDLLDQEFFNNFINVFRRIPQRVLWKSRSNVTELPDNVMMVKWTPQRDVLAHPNVIMFITHGGLLSQHEVMYAGIPVICIPFFSDQPMNAKLYEERGIGIRILFKELSEDTIYSAINQIVTNPMYRENAQSLSRIYRDRPQSPAESLVYWVEYVLRHRGAPHLRPASSDLSWYQLALIDVVATVLIAIITVFLVIYLIIRKIIFIIHGNTNVIRSTKKIN